MPQTTCFGNINSSANNKYYESPASARSRDSSSGGNSSDSDVSSVNNSADTTEEPSGKRQKLTRLNNHNGGSPYRLLVPAALVLWCVLVSIHYRSSGRDAVGPTTAASANEMFDEANETPAGSDAFNDDDDDDDGAMDASASSDYPEGEGGGADDPDDDPDGGESRQSGSWIVPGAHAIPDHLRKRRRRRDMDDVASKLQRHLAVEAKQRSIRLKRPEDMEFSVDDGDEDAWVHDGVDDIHIDPETRQAASQLSHEERSIDAEYEPHQASEQDALVNGTRVTTISEVIPMRRDLIDGSSRDRESTRISARFANPPRVGASLYLPAAYLSIEEAVRLMESSQAEDSHDQRLGRPRRWAPSGHHLANNKKLPLSTIPNTRGRHRARGELRRARAADLVTAASAACRQYPLTDQ